jgi:DNA adenine methylase
MFPAELPAFERTAPQPLPFLKWAGGKRRLVPALLQGVPAQFGAYFEPFVGGGALFFALRPPRAWLSDANHRLVRAYRGVRDDVDGVVARLHTYPHDRKFFLSLREQEIDSRTDADVEAWMIYLNRTGFNGLYRVNKQDRFNVPFGRYTNPTICDEPMLRADAQALRHSELHVADFAAVLERAAAGDFVYFDPPYVPLSMTSSFCSYTQDGFGLADHRRLRDVALALKRRGVAVMVSNSSQPLVVELYAEGFEIREALAARFINSKGDKRGPVKELIIT